ncbi:hypothetical protein N431DRAFT_487789 [Stipitochalara longipes BDJ]|nr:hypothetical protein N431DRAFT_487789 [Stipitochalara longipes BDJ]
MSLIRSGSGMGLTRLGSLLLSGLQPHESFTYDQKHEDDALIPGHSEPNLSVFSCWTVQADHLNGQSSGTSSTFQADTETTPFKCTWPTCTDKSTFSVKSELSKHMNKHARPFTCKNPTCNGTNFGDRAGLQRHEREKHQAARYFCQISACPRHSKGFARKTHLDMHMLARHKLGASNSPAPQNPESPEFDREVETMEGGQIEKENCDMVWSGLDGLSAKLKELEAKRKLLATSQLKVEEDILAVQRTLQLWGCKTS